MERPSGTGAVAIAAKAAAEGMGMMPTASKYADETEPAFMEGFSIRNVLSCETAGRFCRIDVDRSKQRHWHTLT